MENNCMNVEDMMSFLHLMNDLKHLKRQGWVLKDIPEPETVAGHMYRMAVMSLILPDNSGVNRTRCMELSLIHDMGESIIGDITPICGVPREEKLRRESDAIDTLTKLAGPGGQRILLLYKEYEAQATAESRFVKELDRLDLLLQAWEYEQKGHSDLDVFFNFNFSHPTINKLAIYIKANHAVCLAKVNKQEEKKPKEVNQVPSTEKPNGDADL